MDNSGGSRVTIGARALVGLGALLIIVGTFLPWVATGARQRSSFELFGVLDRLDVAPGGVVAALIRVWPVVPLACVATTTAAWWPKRWLATVFAVLVACYAGGVALVVGRAPVRTLGGRAVCLAGATMLVAGTLGWWIAERRLTPTRRAGSSPA